MPMTTDEMRKILEEYGIEDVPPDHPIYSEAASVIFVSRRPTGSTAESDSRPTVDAGSQS